MYKVENSGAISPVANTTSLDAQLVGGVFESVLDAICALKANSHRNSPKDLRFSCF